MDHTRNRGTASVFYIGGSAGNGPGSRDTSEKRGSYIARSLGDQFHVRAVLAANHPVRHHTGKQGFYGRQDCDGKSVRQHILHGLKIKGRQGNTGQFVGYLIQISNGIDFHTNALYHGDTGQHCDQGRRNLLADPRQKRPAYKDHHANHAHDDRLPVYRADKTEHCLQLFHGFDQWFLRDHGKSQKILDLPHKDCHGYAGRKTGCDGIGDKFDQIAQPQHAH